MKLLSAKFTALALTVSVCMLPLPVSAQSADAVFFDDFSGTRLDTDKWLTAQKNWGGTVESDGGRVDYNGGVIPENVSLRDGNLVLTGCGNLYDGDLRGINRDGSRRADGKRCGGAVATREYYASGSYEIRAKIAPVLGCCSAMWTFEYEENYQGDALKITNHEIDIEFPGRDKNDDFSLSHALCTTWLTEDDYKTTSVPCGNQADGQYHIYRFDWHTGSDTESPRVDYYFDGELIHTAEEYIPTNESRFWLGLWFPKNWAGTPDFDTEEFLIDYVKITPFHESGDTKQHESYPDSGWAVPDAALPKGWLLWHSYSKYEALDSRLFLQSPDGVTREITGDFIHAMNGSFGNSPDRFVFMAYNKAVDNWDIYLSERGEITNLTENSGFRNEDPKFSPDEKSIVFKRRRWSQEADGYAYQIARMDLQTNTVTALTDSASELAMPCFSADGQAVYYVEYPVKDIGRIMKLDLQSQKTDVIFQEADVCAYYPIVHGSLLYFTKWLNADNHCDQLMCFDGGQLRALPFNSEKFDCSDACPVGENGMIYSSMADGQYDLWFYNGKTARKWKQSTELNDLGADFFPLPAGDVNADGRCSIADAVLLQKWLSGDRDTVLPDWEAADLDRSGTLDGRDLSRLKENLLGT